MDARVVGFTPDGGVVIEFGGEGGGSTMPAPLPAGASVLGYTPDNRPIVAYAAAAVRGMTAGEERAATAAGGGGEAGEQAGEGSGAGVVGTSRERERQRNADDSADESLGRASTFVGP